MRLALFLFLLALAPSLTAQKISFESTLHYGAIWRHTPKLTIRTGAPHTGQELGIRFQTLGRRAWQTWQRYPAFGMSACHFRFGEGAHEEAFGWLPNLTVPIWRQGDFLASFRLGTGLGWVSKPYNTFHNPGQNAISSHWNDVTQFRLSAELRATPHWSIHAGAALTHFSNGGSKLPNYGVNFPSAFAGVSYQPKPLQSTDFQKSTFSKKQMGRRFGILVQSGIALIEYSLPDGPKYPVWLGSAALTCYWNRVSRSAAGFDYERNTAVGAWGFHTGDYLTKSEARRLEQRTALFAAHEFLFGNLGVQLLRGWYVGQQLDRRYLLRRSYSKLSLRYYFPPMFGSDIRFHAGVTLKAHAVIAEYISWNAGLMF